MVSLTCYFLDRFLLSVLGISIRIRIRRIHMFLGLPDPHQNPFVRDLKAGPDPALDPDLTIIKKKIVRKTLILTVL
jgi:hypothetical protein